MKYKEGDKVKVIENNSGLGVYDKYIGQVGKVTGVIKHITYPYDVLFGDGKESDWKEEELSVVTRGRPSKPKPVKFIAIYDEEDGDPTKKFVSKTALNKWLKEAREDDDIVFESIEVYEVKDVYGVATSFRLKKLT